MSNNIDLMNEYADKLAASEPGYDQSQRWTFNPARDGKSVVFRGEGDCSSTCAAIARAGGIPIDTRDPIYTGNWWRKATAAGMRSIYVGSHSFQDLMNLIQPGDFLLGPGHIVYVRTKNKWWSAEADERGRKSGGQTGAQTPMEARYRGPYNRTRKWEWVLRPDVAAAEPLVAVLPVETEPEPVHVGVSVEPRAIDWHDATFIRIVQAIVGAGVDGIYGPRTKDRVRAWQRQRGLNSDGIFGPKSAAVFLEENGNLYEGRGQMDPQAVRMVQWICRSKVDGSFGPLTTADVKSVQRYVGVEADGNVGATTKERIIR